MRAVGSAIVLCLLAASFAACSDSSKPFVPPGDDGGPPPIDATPAPYCTAKPGTKLKLTKIAEGLEEPVLVTAPAADKRIFVVEKVGRISIVKEGSVLSTPFLDFDALNLPAGDRLNAVGDERGFLGLAFHPSYSTNGRFFVHYTTAENIIVAEYGADPASDTARVAPGKVLIRERHIRDNHNGGTVQFGPDGYLYISIGDGGGANNSEGGGQSTDKLLGKILRIDVNSGSPYGIPTDNPWASGGGVKEMFAWGLRNPYRFWIDPPTKNIFIGDVGQAKFEEVNVIPNSAKGVNFGWPFCEGAEVFDESDPDDDNNSDGPCVRAEIEEPVYAYDQRTSVDPSNPCSVIAGVVYRGTCMPDLNEHFFFGDYCTGVIKSFVYKAGEAPSVVDRTADLNSAQLVRQNLSGFGIDGFGELYVTALGNKAPLSTGTVYRVEVE